MTTQCRSISQIACIVAIVSLGFSTLGFGHGKELEKKKGGPAVQEAGPHGGAAIDIGDGHFELVREADGALSLYRLDGEMTLIPAEDVDAAEIHAIGPNKELFRAAMTKIGGTASAPLHFYIASPQLKSLKAYMAVISVSMGEESQNLRFLVKGV